MARMTGRAVTISGIRSAARAAGLSGRPVCVHASLRSFGRVEGGAQTVVDGLLAEGCTVLVFTLTWVFASPPPSGKRPVRNGMDDACSERHALGGPVYSPDRQEIERDILGAVPAAVIAMPERVRGSHPRDSFAAVGPQARELVSGQTGEDVFAPLSALAEAGGAVVLMGAGLGSMTLLHLAEQQAGRRMFRRWAGGADGQPVEVAEGGCSGGFVNLMPALSPLMTTVTVGTSLWLIFPALAAVDAAAEAIRLNPMITHCGIASCLKCQDAVQGGPILAAEAPL